MFYEKRVTQRISLYFVDLFAHSPKHVMVCGACSAGFAVDSLDETTFLDGQKGTALGTVGKVVDKALDSVDEEALLRGASRLSGAVGESAAQAKDTVNAWMKKRFKKP